MLLLGCKPCSLVDIVDVQGKLIKFNEQNFEENVNKRASLYSASAKVFVAS
jgi:hypothetical protein